MLTENLVQAAAEPFTHPDPEQLELYPQPAQLDLFATAPVTSSDNAQADSLA